MMLPFRNMSFIGTIINAGPLPKGVNKTYWFGWDLSSNISAFDITGRDQNVWALDGTFVNLYEGVLARPPLGTVVNCRPGLINDNATSDWFQRAVGSGKNIKMYWYSDMHSPLDSEMVPVFSNSVSYMASLPNPAMLLASNVHVTGKQYSFVIHGTPVGVLQYFSGTFSKQLPPIGCGIN